METVRATIGSLRLLVVVKTVVKKKKAGLFPASIYEIVDSASKHIRHLDKHIDSRRMNATLPSAHIFLAAS